MAQNYPGTMTQPRVQTLKGQTVDLSKIRALRLSDGWHDVEDCQVTYVDANETPRAVPFAEIQGFSDAQERSQSK